MYKTISLSIQTAIRENADSARIRMVFRILAIGLAGLHAYAAIQSQSMNADGISYLDIGDAYFRGDWANAINAVWSPLYSWILGFANFLFKPAMAWEFPAVHLTNLVIYLGALAAFEFMWGGVLTSSSEGIDNAFIRMPDWLWWTIGYLLFIWVSLSLIQIWAVTPDMLMAIFVFLAAGLVAMIRAGEEDWRLFLSLGLVLGLGYLSKTFMFTTALVFLGLAWFVQKRSRGSLYRTALAFGVFVAVSLPFILLISERTGRFTIGEAGTITYVRYVNGIPFPHWQGDPEAGIAPVHPSRIIHMSPPVYEFGEPIGGTYPISMDPSYWYAGIEPRIDPGGLLPRLFASLLVYMDLFFQKQGILSACVLALYIMGQRQNYPLYGILQRWALAIPAVIALGLYGMVLVEDRYVGVFVLLLWTDILANIHLAADGRSGAWLKTLGMIACLGLAVNIILFNLDGFKRLNPSIQPAPSEQSAPAGPLEVAQALQGLGIGAGDRVGVIGYAYDSFWARLARVKIVAELVDSDAADIWSEQALQESVLRSFAGTGASAVVAEYVPDTALMKGWQRVGNSSCYIYRFTEQ